MKDAKGHGSEKRGGISHQNGVDQVGKPVAPHVLNAMRKNPNGFSVGLKGERPKGGYMVAVPGHSKVLQGTALNGPGAQAIVDDYVRRNLSALRTPGTYVGGWRDKTGKTYLDVSENIPHRMAAIKAGRARNQIAIHDIRGRRDIRTGGTGA